jgi:hypothetical protein
MPCPSHPPWQTLKARIFFSLWILLLYLLICLRSFCSETKYISLFV